MALIEQIPETAWVAVEDYPDVGRGADRGDRRSETWRLIVRRTRLVGAQAELFPDWRHHSFVTNRTVPMLVADVDHRDHATIELVIRDLKDQALAHFPSGQFNANSAWTVIAALAHNLGRWTTLIGLPNHPVQTAGHSPPAAPADPRPTDPHQPHMDSPDARPLAMANRVRHHPHPDPRATPTRLTASLGVIELQQTTAGTTANPAARKTARDHRRQEHESQNPTPNSHNRQPPTSHTAKPGETLSPELPIGGFRFNGGT